MDFSAIPALLSEGSLLALPLVFLGGLLTSLTPCIYPMIPVTAAIVGGQATGEGASRSRVVALTAAYVTGLAMVYALLGVLAAMTGSLFGSISTNPVLYLLMANLLIVFALILFDVLPVPVPQRLLHRAASMSSGGRIAGTFMMGAASGLVAAPCGAPVMGSVLTWVATTKDATLGFTYLFVFSLGMSTLLIVVGLASGGVVQLPRPGKWMVWVQRGFAILLIGVAEYYLIEMGLLLF